jgi:hypothetical protein
MAGALDELPDQFTSSEMIALFKTKYPKIQPSTIRQQLRRCCVNVKLGPYLASWPSEARVLYRVGPRTYTRYRPELHGTFENGVQVGMAELDEDSEFEIAVDDSEPSPFPLEAHLEDFMEANWKSIGFGAPLAIWEADGAYGRQFDTEIGRIDFLCEDKSNGDLVVIELKRGKSSDRVVGQVLRYMGWVRKHLANGGNVRGVVVTHEVDESIRYAVAESPNVEAWTYGVQFSLNREAYK